MDRIRQEWTPHYTSTARGRLGMTKSEVIACLEDATDEIRPRAKVDADGRIVSISWEDYR